MLNFKFNNRKNQQVAINLMAMIYIFTAMILDLSFDYPRTLLIESTCNLLYVAALLVLVYVLISRLMPEFLPDDLTSSKEKLDDLTFYAIAVMSIIIAIQIMFSGGLFSPYVSFLSSFPVLCMVLVFSDVSVKSCVLSMLFIILPMMFIYLIEISIYYLFDISLVANDIAVRSFQASINYTFLTLSIVILSVLANLISIYLSSNIKGSLGQTPAV